MDVMLQPCTSVAQNGWLALRSALWPDSSEEAHLAEMAAFLAEPQRYCQFIAYAGDGAPVGIVEAALRHDYVNGTSSSPVAFLEGIYVAAPFRRRGVGRALVPVVEQWAQPLGCTEIASDALLDNEHSHAMHRALGFVETEKVVYFCKALPSV